VFTPVFYVLVRRAALLFAAKRAPATPVEANAD
jgi:hypothetical protein